MIKKTPLKSLGNKTCLYKIKGKIKTCVKKSNQAWEMLWCWRCWRRANTFIYLTGSHLRKLFLYRRLVSGAHETGRVKPGGLLKVLSSNFWLLLPVPELWHALREILHTGVEISDDSEVHLGLQAGRGADRHAGAFSFDAQVGFSHAGHSVPLLLVLCGCAWMRPPVSTLLLGTDTGPQTHFKCRWMNKWRIRMTWNNVRSLCSQ